MRSACGQPHVAEHARRQEIIRIGDHRPPAHCTRADIKAVIGEVDPSPPFIPRLVLKADFDPLVDRYASLLLSEMLPKQRLRALEAEIDRVEIGRASCGERVCQYM